MSCAVPQTGGWDLRDYLFGALSEKETQTIGKHLRECEECSAEFERLRATTLALRSMPEEEIPRRIAFVSDRVFEPSRAARWWRGFWSSSARVASGALALLAVAVLIHAFRPEPAPIVRIIHEDAGARSGTPVSDAPAIQALVDRAVAKAVAASDAKYDLKFRTVLDENRRQKWTIARAAEVIEDMNRREHVNIVAANRPLENLQ